MLPTLADVLSLPELASGEPVVLAGEEGLGRPVRWVHVSELPDIASLLRGGELILTTGIALPASQAGLRRYVAELRAAGACGLVVELGRRFEELPAAMVEEAVVRGLPVVALRRTVPFVAVTETVHALIVDTQHERLKFSARAHEAFTTLSIEGASAQDIVERVAAMSGLAVVLEDLSHRAVAYAAGPTQVAELLRDWEARSRATPGLGGRDGLGGLNGTDGTGVVGAEGWLVTPVGPRLQRWGRLVLTRPVTEHSQLRMLLERAAEALALHRLLERDRASLEHQAHRGLLGELVGGRGVDEADLQARAAALGLAVAGRRFLGVAVHAPPVAALDPLSAETRDRMLVDAVARALRRVQVSGLASTLRQGQVLVLVAPAGRPADLHRHLERLARAVAEELLSSGWEGHHTVGVGSVATSLLDSAGSLVEAGHVAAVAADLSDRQPRSYYEGTDVRLRGLLAALREDPRLVAFAESELDRLLAHDARHGTDLVGTLRQYLDCRGNKARLARAAHLSRPTLYARLATISRVLVTDLDDAESCLSLHVALLVREVRLGTSVPDLR